MPAIVLVGAQWGDEGKGKATDLLGDRVDYVVGTRAGTTPATRLSSARRATRCTCCPRAC
jgi:adenylosuccinate synthase